MSKNFEICKTVVLEATPEQVWRVIATPEGQAAWSPDPYQSIEGMDIEVTENERLALYADTDREATEQSWADWLARVCT